MEVEISVQPGTASGAVDLDCTYEFSELLYGVTIDISAQCSVTAWRKLDSIAKASMAMEVSTLEVFEFATALEVCVYTSER